MKKIKNVIFDLGGIFLDIHFAKTEKAFTELGVTNWKNFYTQNTASKLFEQLETGALNPEGFYEAFRTETGLNLSNNDIKMAWNSMLGTFPAERLEWLEQIGKRYNVYLYSNTNAIHLERFQEIFRESTGRSSFNDFFIKAHYSHELGLRKPYPESFTALLEKENLVGAETLFVDDTEKNIEGAKLAGLQTALVIPPKTVFDLGL